MYEYIVKLPKLNKETKITAMNDYTIKDKAFDWTKKIIKSQTKIIKTIYTLTEIKRTDGQYNKSFYFRLNPQEPRCKIHNEHRWRGIWKTIDDPTIYRCEICGKYLEITDDKEADDEVFQYLK
jgi:rubrerythrin